MIGIIETVIVDCLLQVGDDELRQDVFLAAGIPPDRIYRIDQHYSDEETQRLIASVLKVTQLEPEQLFNLFSSTFFDFVEKVFPGFLALAVTSEDLVRRQAKIHALIASGSRDSGLDQTVADKFHIQHDEPHQLTVRYKSKLQLCGLYEALVQEAARRFGDTVEFKPHTCAHDGADACVMVVRWTSIASRPTHFALKDERRAMTRARTA